LDLGLKGIGKSFGSMSLGPKGKVKPPPVEREPPIPDEHLLALILLNQRKIFERLVANSVIDDGELADNNQLEVNLEDPNNGFVTATISGTYPTSSPKLTPPPTQPLDTGPRYTLASTDAGAQVRLAIPKRNLDRDFSQMSAQPVDDAVPALTCRRQPQLLQRDDAGAGSLEDSAATEVASQASALAENTVPS
jgi:hypothetical protein